MWNAKSENDSVEKKTENESRGEWEYTGASWKPREGRGAVSRSRGCQHCQVVPRADRNATEQRHGLCIFYITCEF